MTRDSLLAVERRLSGASEGSRELDALVAIASGDAVCVNPKYPTFVRYRDKDTGEPNELNSRAAPVTESIDAALALVSRCLPDMSFELARSAAGPPTFTRCRLWDWKRGPLMIDPANEWNAEGNVPLPINICLALCRALLAKETE